MDIQASKIELAKMIMEIEDSSVIDRFINFIKSESTLSDRQKKAIDSALVQLQNGGGIPHDVVMAETKARYPKYFK
ncbi:hypothetical protein FMM05_08305 [Flavobacterium zepuense]|uniref:Uncharacterized protein n=1 Tax=Flavobacterium zepuense TaxID=2593302 RepID=A0A552V487_9FLAO|nr:hypothetical protein [Flavobacterium zepuense]TRW25296.1 hypothetical protein FMM05_08305 [Flavobacterium zepuense]